MSKNSTGRRYAPTMVANGRKGRVHNPLHGSYRRNPNPLGELGDLDDSNVATIAAPAKKRGRPAGSKNKTHRAAATHTATEPKTRRAAGKTPTDILAKINKLVSGLNAAHAKPGRPAKAPFAAKLPSIRIEVAGAGSTRKKASATKADGTPAKKRGRPAGSKNKPKTQLAANGRRSFRRNPEESAEATGKRGKRTSTKLGPYKFTLLKNPVMDFSVGGVKVVPALAGTVGAIGLSQFVRNLPYLDKIENPMLRKATPSIVTVALAAVAHFYAKKHKQPLLAEIASDVAAFGIAFGLNDIVGAKVSELVNSIKSAPALPAPATAPMSGGRFASPALEGGGWATDLHGAQGYPPALQGYWMDGDANSASALTNMTGGQFGKSLGGHDVSEFSDF